MAAEFAKSDLLEALRPVKSELRCAVCGYGAVSQEAPETCPMCQSTAWEPVPWRPFSRGSDFQHEAQRESARRSA